jgi:hypothetical protein
MARAGWSLIKENVGTVAAAVPAYFDGQPLSRMPEGLFFYERSPTDFVAPENLLDIACALFGAVAVTAAGIALYRSIRRMNAPLFVLAAELLSTIAAVIVARESSGNFLNVRRYMWPAAIAFSAWAGLVLAWGSTNRSRWLRVGAAAFGVLFAGRVVLHEYRLLRMPDQLAEVRGVIGDMYAKGIRRGLASFGVAYTIDALTNQRIVVAPKDFVTLPNYTASVAAAEYVAVIGRTRDPAEPRIEFGGGVYVPSEPPIERRTLRWSVYRKMPDADPQAR